MIHAVTVLNIADFVATGEQARRQPQVMLSPVGSYMVEPMMANTVKQNITRNVYAVGRLAHDIAGGFLATLPEEAAFDHPDIGKWVRKYHLCNEGDDVMERVRYGRYIENAASTTTLVEAMHGAGSPQAQRIVMLGLGNLKNKIGNSLFADTNDR